MTSHLITADHLDPRQRDAVLALAERATAYDGVAPLNEATHLAIAHDTPGQHVVAQLDDRLAGYLFLAGDTAECVVDPDVRRQGVGRGLVEYARPPAVWAHGDLPAAQATAAALGFAGVRTLLKLATTLSSPPEVPAPAEGITVRTFEPGRDDAAVLRVNGRAFAYHPEQGAMDRRDLDQRMAEGWFDPEGFFLAERAGELLGFHWTKAEDDEGEVYVVGVDPDAQGLGLGTLLTQTGLRHLYGRGLRTVTLYVESDNAPALAVYARSGFTEAARDTLYRA